MQSQSHDQDHICSDCLAAAIIEGLMQLAAKFESNELIPITKIRGEIHDGEVIIVDRREIIIPARQIFVPANYDEN